MCVYVYVFVIHEVYNCCCCRCGLCESHWDVLMHVLRYMWYICCSCMYFLFSIRYSILSLFLAVNSFRVAVWLTHSNNHSHSLCTLHSIKLISFPFPFPLSSLSIRNVRKISTKSYMNRFVYTICNVIMNTFMSVCGL